MPDEAKRELSKLELQASQEVIDTVEMFNDSYAMDLDNDSRLISRKEGYQTFREMTLTDIVYKSLEIVADDSSQKNQEGNVLAIYSDDERIKERLEDLFYDRLNVNNTLWSVIIEMVQMGDNFYEVQVDDLNKPKKIMALKYLEPDKTDRIEIDGRLAFFIYHKVFKNNFMTRSSPQKVKEILYRLMPWQVVHFLIDDKETAPYGRSLLKSGVRTWDRILKIEDAALVYRISRAPERRVFYVDVGGLNNIEASKFLRKFKDNYRTQALIDEDGKINKRASVLSITSDIFIPVRGGEGGNAGTKIDTLQGGTALGGQDDLLKYFKDKLIRLLNIPPAYLGDDADRSRGALSQLDIKFSRFIERIQNRIITGLNKIAALDLYFGGFKADEINNFKLELTPPSNIREVTELEFINQKIGLIQSMISLNIFPTNYILKKILNMSDKEISNLQFYKKLEMEQAAATTGGAETAAAGGALPPEMAGGALPPEMAGGALPPEMGAGTVPPEAAGGVVPPEAAPIPQESFVNILGKDFLLENQKDFFKIVKFLELNEEVVNDKEKLSPIIEMMAQNVQRRKLSGFKTSEIESYKINNEFGGIDFGENKMMYFKEAFDSIEKMLSENVNDHSETSKIPLQES